MRRDIGNASVAAAFVVLAVAVVHASAVSFVPAGDAAVGDGPRAVAAGHFTPDTRIDLAVVNADSDSVTILAGRGDGTFAAAGPALPVGLAPVSVAAADINADGALDIVTADEIGNTVSVMLNDRAGGFADAIVTDVGSVPEMVVAADFDGDRRLDIATADAADDAITILTGLGNGRFAQPRTIPVGTAPVALAVGLIDADAAIDLAVANSAGGSGGHGSVSLLKGLGDGQFAAQAPLESPSFRTPIAIAVVDLDGDRHLDLVVVNEDGDTLSILPGQENFAFGEARDVVVARRPQAVAVADFDGNGNLDAATTSLTDGRATILLGDGHGALTVAGAVPTGVAPVGIVAADLDGDRRADLAAANLEGGSVSILLNGAAACSDCNGDGTVAVDDLLTIVGIVLGHAALDRCPSGDVNGDRQVTVGDAVAAVGQALNGCRDGAPVSAPKGRTGVRRKEG